MRNLFSSQKNPRAAAMGTTIDFILGDVPPEALQRHLGGE